jgi:preprotein translocase subunit SecD
MLRTRLSVAASVILALALVGCAEGDATKVVTEEAGSTSQEAESSPAGESGTLQFRVVTGSDISPAPPGDGPTEVQDAYDALACPEEVDPPEAADFAAVCGPDDVRYLLEPAVIVGGVEDAAASIPENYDSYVVTIDLDREATAVFTDLSAELAGTQEQYAVLLGGEVLTAPTIDAVITDGMLQISGGFDEQSAHDLAERILAAD